MNAISLKEIRKLQVSSVVKNDTNFGKRNIFDGNEETCWKSDEGSPQWILVEFEQPQSFSSFSIQFQGGFVGQNCQAEFSNNQQQSKMAFYPEDANSLQKFILPTPVVCKQVKFIFQGSTDFYGRVIVYSIDFQ